MEKSVLIKKRFGLFVFTVLIMLVLYMNPTLASSKGSHVFKLHSKESFEVRNGRIIYLEHCAPCHGNTGKGNGNYYASGLEPKPRNFTDPVFMNQAKDEYLAEVIRKGTAAFGKSPFCPPWGATLKEEEKIENIIVFLRTLTSK